MKKILAIIALALFLGGISATTIAAPVQSKAAVTVSADEKKSDKKAEATKEGDCSKECDKKCEKKCEDKSDGEKKESKNTQE